MRDDAVLGRALPLDRGLGPLYSNTVIGTLAVPNVIVHPSTARVPTSYYSMWRYNYFCTQRVKIKILVHAVSEIRLHINRSYLKIN